VNMPSNLWCPFVSIVVPAYNAELTAVQCAESLIRQDYPADRYEVLFVDNASTDATVEKLTPYVGTGRGRILSEARVLNAYGARNTGIRAAAGEIIAFTDADCEAAPNWISQLISGFRDLRVGCVAGEISPAKPRNVFEKYGDTAFLSQRKGLGLAFPPVKGGNCAFRRSALDVVGLFRDDFPSGGDTELAWRIAQKTRMTIAVNLDAIVFHHNVSSLRSFMRQSMRYGTHIYFFTQLPSGESKLCPSLSNALMSSATYLAVFSKRVTLTMLHRVPPTVSVRDRDICLMRPLLRVLSEWAMWYGHKFGLRNPGLLR
jgi:cellulose synthase/poly-beta-1,6-N-acetylglucosamine synthase-like glycosyltransferase